jgi:hypothetical protein
MKAKETGRRKEHGGGGGGDIWVTRKRRTIN